MFASASSLVAPWLTHPGIAGHSATNDGRTFLRPVPRYDLSQLHLYFILTAEPVSPLQTWRYVIYAHRRF